MKKIAIIAAAASLSIAPMTVKAANPLDALGGILSSVTSTTNFEISDITGVWAYQSPAVSFKSDNTLSKIGGLAASAALEDKLAQYYDAVGLNTLEITINTDETFAMKVRGITLTGTVAKDGDGGNLTFTFSAFGKISIGAVSAMAEKSATNNLTLTFDVSKVITIIEKVSSIVNISSIQTLVALLQNYEDLYAGARLKKIAEAPATGDSGSASEGNATSGAEALKNLLKK